jgi:hypothetical protein
MKKMIKEVIYEILESNKFFIINLFKGDERCIHGDLYCGINSRSENLAALEYPIGNNNERADIVLFSDCSYTNISNIIELKHYSPNQSNSPQVVIGNIQKQVSNRFKIGVNSLFVIHILTQIEEIAPNLDVKSVLKKYSFTKSYVHSEKNINKSGENIRNITTRVKKEIDEKFEYFSMTRFINKEIKVNLHFFICGPFERNKLYDKDSHKNGLFLILDNFPINKQLAEL